jgi:NACHT domain
VRYDAFVATLKLIAAEAAIKKTIDLIADRAQAYLARPEVSIQTSSAEITRALEAHRTEIENWSAEISFRDMARGKKTDDVYVPLNLYLAERRTRFDVTAEERSVAMDELLTKEPGHCIIFGQPGAGKTTSIKHVCRRFIKESTFLANCQALILIRLRELNSIKGVLAKKPLILARIRDIVGLRFSLPSELNGPDEADVKAALIDRLTVQWMNTAKVLLLLDGFDELSNFKRMDSVVAELRSLGPQLASGRCIVTSRTGEFYYHLEGFRTFEIQPLTEVQIEQLAIHWLGKTSARDLVKQIKASPFMDAAIRPLTIAHLCAIYERSRKIPDKPKTVYRKVVGLLLEEWDEQRSIKRPSSYANFDADRKAEFLSNLAYWLTTELQQTIFAADQLKAAYKEISPNFGLPERDASRVAKEIESHTGLFVQAGHDFFEFSHKSLQEYLAADFIVRLPLVPPAKKGLIFLPNELAIAVAISSRPSAYFTSLVQKSFRGVPLTFAFVRAFVSRLLLERPDFEQTESVGLALLELYSRYLALFLSNTGQLEFFIYDDLAAEFQALRRFIRDRLDIDKVLLSYQLVQTAQTVDGQNARLVELRGDAKQIRRSQSQGLPRTLWLREVPSQEGSADQPLDSAKLRDQMRPHLHQLAGYKDEDIPF